jgi:hypothetical protein
MRTRTSGGVRGGWGNPTLLLDLIALGLLLPAIATFGQPVRVPDCLALLMALELCPMLLAVVLE